MIEQVLKIHILKNKNNKKNKVNQYSNIIKKRGFT